MLQTPRFAFCQRRPGGRRPRAGSDYQDSLLGLSKQQWVQHLIQDLADENKGVNTAGPYLHFVAQMKISNRNIHTLLIWTGSSIRTDPADEDLPDQETRKE